MCLLNEIYMLCIVFISAREYLTGCFNIKMGDFSPCFSPQRLPVFPTATTTCEVLLSEADPQQGDILIITCRVTVFYSLEKCEI